MEDDAIKKRRFRYIQKSITITPEQYAKLYSYRLKGYNVSQIVRYIIDAIPEQFNDWNNFQIIENNHK